MRFFNCFDGGFPDAVPVASALPDRLSFQCSGSDPAPDGCIIHPQPFRYFMRGKVFLFHTRINVLTMLFCMRERAWPVSALCLRRGGGIIGLMVKRNDN